MRGGGLKQRVRDLLVTEADAEAQAGEAVLDEPLHVARGLLAELQAGRQQQLAAGQPGRRVREL